tara:strand:- start:6365 stop:6613 length:249 start_codon:yes stop_codon:yes gene_type:complete
MEFVLTIIMCAFIDGKTSCMPPHTFKDKYEDAYSCMLDGYSKSYDKIVELGREEVNLYNIYLKFGCNENQSNKTSISSKQFR